MSESVTVRAPRLPVRHATYPGNHSSIVGQVKGPNLLREFLTAVTAKYDADADKTRVGFAYATTHDFTASLRRGAETLGDGNGAVEGGA